MRVVLSQRNLLTLLHKLTIPGSQRTIMKSNGTRIVAETDEIHYGNRPPGPVNPDIEDFIIEYEAFLAERRK